MIAQPIGVLFDVILRSDFQAFVEKAFRVVYPHDMYVSGWHIRAVCWHLKQVLAGTMPRLIVNLPPRSLKSFIVSVAWPAFILGRDPSRRIICVSYSEDLAKDHARLFRFLVGSAFYRRLFPLTRVSASKNTETMVATTKNGFRLATSIGGTLTGKGGHLIIIDDPMKAEGVNSENDRQRVIDWFKSTLISRLDDPVLGQIVVVQQRIHAFDLSGYLLEQGGWKHLSLAAECRRDIRVAIGPRKIHFFKEGHLLHPERLPISVLKARYKELGSAQFSAQYLQDPVPPEGTIIKRAWFRYYEGRLAPHFIEIIQSWDVAAKIGVGNDWSVCVTLGVAKDGYYVIDVARMKVEFPDLLKASQRLANAFRPDRILIEEASNGLSLLQSLSAATALNVIGIKPRQDKEARVNGVSAMFESGKVRFEKNADWLPVLERELVEFPGGRNDDQVDALSQLLAWVRDHAERYLPLVLPILLPKADEDRFTRDEDYGSLDDDMDEEDAA